MTEHLLKNTGDGIIIFSRDEQKVGMSDVQMYGVNRYRMLRSLAVYYKNRKAVR